MEVSPPTRTYLCRLARRRLEEALARRLGAPGTVRTAVPDRPDDPLLDRPSRLFVSWHVGGRLVGCLGQLAPAEPLERAVARLAVAAGLFDPRTSGVRPVEVPHLSLEISLLSEPRWIEGTGFGAIARAIVPGRDGVLLTLGDRRAFFLPQVWKSLPDTGSFLAALARKGGMPLSRARNEARAAVVQATVLDGPPARTGAA